MAFDSISFFENPPENGHMVFPYTDEKRAMKAVAAFVAGSLKNGGSAILILTTAHWEAIRAQLKRDKFDFAALKDSDRFICADAARMLQSFMVDDMPDAAKFESSIGWLMERAKGKWDRAVRAYGEMVDLLWQAGNTNGALALEQLWNLAIAKHDICLLCTYCTANCVEGGFPVELLEAHSHVCGLAHS